MFCSCHSSLLDSLEQFTQRILLNSTDTFSVNEDNFQIVIQDQAMADFAGLTYTPDVDPYLQEFQQDATRTPVQGASISLPGDLESFLQNDRSTLRVSTLAIFKDTLFVQNRTSELAMDLARGNRTLGNIIISASLPQFEKVDGPTVVIRYTLTEVSDLVQLYLALLCKAPVTSTYMYVLIKAGLHYTLVYFQGLQQASLLRAECVFWLEECKFTDNWVVHCCQLMCFPIIILIQLSMGPGPTVAVGWWGLMKEWSLASVHTSPILVYSWYAIN